MIRVRAAAAIATGIALLMVVQVSFGGSRTAPGGGVRVFWIQYANNRVAISVAELGRRPRRLVSGDLSGYVSPDGAAVAVSQGSQLSVVGVTTKRRVLLSVKKRSLTHPIWSSDGRFIAVGVGPPGRCVSGRWDLAIVDVRSGRATVRPFPAALAAGSNRRPVVILRALAWTTDGHRIAVAREAWQRGECYHLEHDSGEHEIAVVSVGGGSSPLVATRVVAAPLISVRDALWSRDGQALVFESGTSSDCGVYVLLERGSAPIKVIGGDSYGIQTDVDCSSGDVTFWWSPRGLVYVRGDAILATSGRQTHVLKRLGKGAHPCSGKCRAEIVGGSVEGDRVVYAENVGQPNERWFVLGASGSDTLGVLARRPPDASVVGVYVAGMR